MLNSNFLRKFKKSFKIFANETSMHGFKDLYSANHLVATIVWLMVLTFALLMTGLHVAQAVKGFAEQKTTMLIQPAKDDQFVKFPQLRIVHPHWLYWVDFNRSKALNFSKEETLYALSHIGNIFSSKVFNISEVRENFLSSMTANNFSNLKEFFLAIVNQTVLSELKLSGLETSIVVPFNIGYHTANFLQLSQFIEEETIKSLNINPEFGEENRVILLNIQNKGYNHFEKYITKDEYERYVKDWLQNWALQRSLTGDTTMYMSYSICPIGSTYITCFTVNNAYFLYRVYITLIVYKWKNTYKAPCVEKMQWISPDSTCRHACMRKALTFFGVMPSIEDFRKFCMLPIRFLSTNGTEQRGERGLFENLGAEEMQKCSIESEVPFNNETFNANIKRVTNLRQCIKDCEQSCIEYRYQFTLQRDSVQSESNNMSNWKTVVIIQYPQKRDVMLMTEDNLQTWENFIGNVGGLLGIWTGASILSFVQTIYLCCCQYDRRNSDGSIKRKRNRKQNGERDTSQIIENGCANVGNGSEIVGNCSENVGNGSIIDEQFELITINNNN